MSDTLAPETTPETTPEANRPTSERPVALGSAQTVWLVARREIVTRTRSTSFVLGTLGILVAFAAYVALMSVVSDDSKKVAFVGPVGSVAEPFRATAEQLGTEVRLSTVADVATAERQLRDGDLDVLVTGTSGTDVEVVVRSELDPQLRAALDAQLQQRALDAELTRAGVDPAQVRQAVAASLAQPRVLDPVDPDRGQRLALSLAGSILLYFFLIIFGVAVAQGVVEEKSSRVVELLLATVRPWQLMAGKIIGIGVVGLIQFAVIGGVGLAGALATDLLTLPSASAAGALVAALFWYVIGFFLFAAMLAATAALVSRQEDVSSVVQPVMVVIAVTFVLSIALLTDDPEDPLVELLSFVPPFSPVLMPARTALGGVPLWQVGLSTALALAALAALAWWGGRVYSYAVLRTGARVSFAEALRRRS